MRQITQFYGKIKQGALLISYMHAAPDEEPVYTIDYRGLRVRAGSVGKTQNSATSAVDPAISQIKKDTRPKSASAATTKLSVCK